MLPLCPSQVEDENRRAEDGHIGDTVEVVEWRDRPGRKGVLEPARGGGGEAGVGERVDEIRAGEVEFEPIGREGGPLGGVVAVVGGVAGVLVRSRQETSEREGVSWPGLAYPGRGVDDLTGSRQRIARACSLERVMSSYSQVAVATRQSKLTSERDPSVAWSQCEKMAQMTSHGREGKTEIS